MPGTDWTRTTGAREPGAHAADLFRHLLWPRIFRAPGLALRPERLFVGLLMVVLLELIARIPEMWHGEQWRAAVAFPMEEVAEQPLWAWPLAFLAAAWHWGWGLARVYPWSAALVKVLSLIVISFGGCMLCRMAACDFSIRLVVGIAEARSFTTKRLGSVLFAVLGPVILALLIAFGLAVGGLVLFGVPYVNVLGAILYFLFLIAGGVITVILIAYAFGYPLLIPAVACEGSDGIDAIGRVYPYVFSRPLRLILYYLIAVALGCVAAAVVWIVLATVANVTSTATTWFLSPGAATTFSTFVDPAQRPGGGAAAASIVNFWTGLLLMLGAAYVVSYTFCASTIVYLLMRRLCDGQDTSELWMPGMVEGTMAESMQARATVAGTAGGPPA
ncbi:MAG: hypothetical protein IT437_08085 [Phycisphaerales bacterium]|nr:hypothetical protein [Phycisphaerales bacterium]